MTTQATLPIADARKPLYVCDFSPCRGYRYTLLHRPGDGPLVMFIGLNPSTADEYQLDSTLKRIERWVVSWGYAGFIMTNLFAFRSPHPRVMKLVSDPVGRHNDAHLLKTAASAKLIVAAWGNDGAYRGRAKAVECLLGAFDLHCLGRTADGFPIHPLARGRHRVSDDVRPVFYQQLR